MPTLFGLYPFLLKLYADGGYQGPQFQAALRRVFRQLNIEIVKQPPRHSRFYKTLDRRTHHRLAQSMPQGAKDWECLNRKSPGVSALGFNPGHAEKALPENNIILDRLSGCVWHQRQKR